MVNESPFKGVLVLSDLDGTLILSSYKYGEARERGVDILAREFPCFERREIAIIPEEIDARQMKVRIPRKRMRRDRFPVSWVEAYRMLESGRVSREGVARLRDAKDPVEKKELLDSLGYDEKRISSYAQMDGRDFERNLRESLGGTERSLYETIAEALQPPWKLRAGAIEAVDELVYNGAYSEVITVGDRLVQLEKRSSIPEISERFPLDRYRVVLYDKVPMIRRVMNKYSVPPERTVFVGDAYSDMDAAQKAGVLGLQVPYGNGGSWLDRMTNVRTRGISAARKMEEVPGKIRELLSR
jgi:hypothetical protein